MRAAVLRHVAVHDRYQLELKLGYPLAHGKKTRYRIDTYFFAPHSLGINAVTYPRQDFYRDIQHYVRMKTPRFQLAEVLDDTMSPLRRSEALVHASGAFLSTQSEEKLRDSLRILRAVLKSAAQSHMAPLNAVVAAPTESTAATYVDVMAGLTHQVQRIQSRYRALAGPLRQAGASQELLHAYHLTDESMSILVEDLLLRAHQLAVFWLPPPEREAWQEQLAALVRAEMEHRTAQGYPSVLRKTTGEAYLLRVSALKKFTSSVLWLATTTRREGTTLEQFLFSLAAGISMVFATLVAFYAQAIYGQLTLPVFVALVVAYMFKDRIKEQGRAISAHLLSRHLYDYRTVIQTHGGRRNLGQVREKMTHLDARQLPALAAAARAAGPFNEPEFAGNPESVLLYSKLVELRNDAFNYLSADGLEISAINDIMRFDVRPFLRKMDDPYQERLMLKGDKVLPVRCHRTYHLNLVSIFADETGATTCERTLVVLDRKGIQRIAQYDALGEVAPEGVLGAVRVLDLAEVEA